jgi:hypothetical protein
MLLCFSSDVLAKTLANGTLFGSFAGELGALKTQLYTFTVGAVADFAKLVFPCYATHIAVWAVALLHFWAFLAGYSADTNFHSITSMIILASII